MLERVRRCYPGRSSRRATNADAHGKRSTAIRPGSSAVRTQAASKAISATVEAPAPLPRSARCSTCWQRRRHRLDGDGCGRSAPVRRGAGPSTMVTTAHTEAICGSDRPFGAGREAADSRPEGPSEAPGRLRRAAPGGCPAIGPPNHGRAAMRDAERAARLDGRDGGSSRSGPRRTDFRQRRVEPGSGQTAWERGLQVCVRQLLSSRRLLKRRRYRLELPEQDFELIAQGRHHRCRLTREARGQRPRRDAGRYQGRRGGDRDSSHVRQTGAGSRIARRQAWRLPAGVAT